MGLFADYVESIYALLTQRGYAPFNYDILAIDAVVVMFAKHGVMATCMVPGMQIRKAGVSGREALCRQAVEESIRELKSVRKKVKRRA